jgi:hypothetical protein
MPTRNDSDIRPVTVPMAGTAAESVKSARITSSVTYGVDGDPRNFGVCEQRNIDAAEALANAGLADGVRVVTGRDRHSRFTGA